MPSFMAYFCLLASATWEPFHCIPARASSTSPNSTFSTRLSGISRVRRDVSPFSALKWYFLLLGLSYGYLCTCLFSPSGLISENRKPVSSPVSPLPSTSSAPGTSTVSGPCRPPAVIGVSTGAQHWGPSWPREPAGIQEVCLGWLQKCCPAHLKFCSSPGEDRDLLACRRAEPGVMHSSGRAVSPPQSSLLIPAKAVLGSFFRENVSPRPRLATGRGSSYRSQGH